MVCNGFHYSIELASRSESITAVQVVDKTAELKILTDGEVTQRIHGIVHRFDKGDIGHHHIFYGITLVPAIERLSLRYNSCIFQTQSAPEIMSVYYKKWALVIMALHYNENVSLANFVCNTVMVGCRKA